MNEETKKPLSANLNSISNRIKEFADQHPELTVPIAQLLLSMIGFAEIRRSNRLDFGPSECMSFMEKHKPKEVGEDLKMDFLAIHGAAMIINMMVGTEELPGIEEYLVSLMPPKKVGPLEEFLRRELDCLPPQKNLGKISFFLNQQIGRYSEDFVVTDSRPIGEDELDNAIKKYYEGLGGKVDFTRNSTPYFKTKINGKLVAGVITNEHLIRITIHEY
ncbi:MAG: hypothetical protein WCX80_01385 [Patescibacteria group bacterium]|jgi:hypothetical protein